jgi:hypothetical protein
LIFWLLEPPVSPPVESLQCLQLLELPDLVHGQGDRDRDRDRGVCEAVRLGGSDDRRRYDGLGQQPGQRDLVLVLHCDEPGPTERTLSTPPDWRRHRQR